MKNKTFKKAGFKPAFTMIELVFVIVVLGILAAVAIPRLAATRDDAILVKGKSQISAIRSGIATQKSKRLLEGSSPFVPRTLDANNSTDNLFSNGQYGTILEYGLQSGTKDGEWEKTNPAASANINITYVFHIENKTVQFDYNSTSGKFDCNKTAGATNRDLCKDLTK